jgi:drug/metabolite transporter (DMT)-like permease
VNYKRSDDVNLGIRKGVYMYIQVFVAICIVFGAIGQILMKTGMSQIRDMGSLRNFFKISTIIQIFTNFYVICGLFLYLIASFFWLGALSTLDVSYLYPLLSLGYVLTSLLGMFFLRENIPMLRWFGIFLVVIGCFLILKT